jgi:hypothetical protein
MSSRKTIVTPRLSHKATVELLQESMGLTKKDLKNYSTITMVGPGMCLVLVLPLQPFGGKQLEEFLLGACPVCGAAGHPRSFVVKCGDKAALKAARRKYND